MSRSFDKPQPVDSEVTIVDLYKNPDYITLYRYENPQIPYEEGREGTVSKKHLIGSWYTDNLSDLKTYVIRGIKGIRGGRFVVVRVKKSELNQYDATLLPDTVDMDIEKGNYIIPSKVASESKVEIPSLFKDEWEGKKNIPFGDWSEIEGYIERHLSDEAIVARLEK